MLIGLGGPTHCGLYHSLGFRSWTRFKGRKLAQCWWALILCSFALDHAYEGTSCFKFLLPWFPHSDGLYLGIVGQINPFYLKLLWSGHFYYSNRKKNQNNLINRELRVLMRYHEVFPVFPVSWGGQMNSPTTYGTSCWWSQMLWPKMVTMMYHEIQELFTLWGTTLGKCLLTLPS